MNRLSLFIIGMPRSGTKLFRELLNNHDKIFIPDNETVFITKYLKKYGHKSLSAAEIGKIIDEIKKTLFAQRYLNTRNFNFDNLQAEDINITNFIHLFFHEMCNQIHGDARIIGDKSPNYIYDVKLLMSYFPNVKFIHIVRDPRDYVLSMNKAWGKNIYRAAYRWKKAVSQLNKTDYSEKDKVFEIRYEDLIQHPETTLMKVCNFLEIEYAEGLIKLDKGVENLGDAKSASIKTNNAKKYLDELSNREIRRIEKLTHPVLSYYYEGMFEIDKEINPPKFLLTYWKMLDGLNLLKFNFKTHGISKGLEKILKARKAKF